MKAAQQPDEPLGNVRYDIGGWISGPSWTRPCRTVAPRIVPRGSTPLRELADAIAMALGLPRPATERDEHSYLRITRGPGQAGAPGLPEDHGRREIEDDDADH